MVDSKENYKFDVGVKVLGYKHLSWYSSFQSVGIFIGNVRQRIWNMESGLEIKYWGGEGQESQFHSLFFMQAAIIAYNICTAKQNLN